jgi:hypothetical protein
MEQDERPAVPEHWNAWHSPLPEKKLMTLYGYAASSRLEQDASGRDVACRVFACGCEARSIVGEDRWYAKPANGRPCELSGHMM